MLQNAFQWPSYKDKLKLNVKNVIIIDYVQKEIILETW